MLHDTQPFIKLTATEFREMFGDGTTSADTREAMRDLLDELPDAARTAYNRENIRPKNTPLLTVIETVLYHFDRRNFAKVADELGIEKDALEMLLIGYVLGREMQERRAR